MINANNAPLKLESLLENIGQKKDRENSEQIKQLLSKRMQMREEVVNYLAKL